MHEIASEFLLHLGLKEINHLIVQKIIHYKLNPESSIAA